VVLTQAKDSDITHQHHFVVAFIKNGPVDNLIQRLAVAAGEKAHGLGHSLGGFEQPLSLGVFAYF
jgi:hypothetical protein